MQILLGGALLDPKCQLQDGYTSTNFIEGCITRPQNVSCRMGTLVHILLGVYYQIKMATAEQVHSLFMAGGGEPRVSWGGDFLGTGKGVASQ